MSTHPDAWTAAGEAVRRQLHKHHADGLVVRAIPADEPRRSAFIRGYLLGAYDLHEMLLGDMGGLTEKGRNWATFAAMTALSRYLRSVADGDDNPDTPDDVMRRTWEKLRPSGGRLAR